MNDPTVGRARVLARLSVLDRDGDEHIPTRQAERRLLLLLAVHGRRVHADHAVAVLWPIADPSTGHRRLREVLRRLPPPLAPLIAREGSTLVLRAVTDLEDGQTPPGRPLTITVPQRLAEGAAMPSEPYVLQPGEGRAVDLGNFLMTVKATSAQTDGAFTLLEAEEPPHFGPPMHTHRDAAEAFYVLDGEYIVFIEDREIRCPAGSFVYIPAGAVHGFRVGAQQSRKLNLYVPEAMVGYFDELAAAISSGDLDDAHLGAIAERYGMEVLGPVPEGYA